MSKHRHPSNWICRRRGHDDFCAYSVGPSGSGTKKPTRFQYRCRRCHRRRWCIRYDWWSLVGLKLGIDAIDEIGRGNYGMEDFLEAVLYDEHWHQEPTRHRRVT